MDGITKITEESLTRYFKALSQKGYMPYNSVFNLLLVLFLDELLTNFSDFITENDYNIIIKNLYKLASNECLISYPSFKEYDELIRNTYRKIDTRITEDSILRLSEDGLFRVET